MIHSLIICIAIRGFHNTTLTLRNIKQTVDVLTDIMGYRLAEQHVNRYRFVTDAVADAAVIDWVEAPGEPQGVVAGGSIHHVAFRVKDDAAEMALREKIVADEPLESLGTVLKLPPQYEPRRAQIEAALPQLSL
jgi:glyoxalase family protein